VRVLVTGPSDFLRELMSLELEEAGISTVVFESLAEALQLAHLEPPDVILVDATQAPWAGTRFIGELRADARTKEVPVVGIAFVPGAEQPMLEAGAVCCLRALPAKGDVLKAVTWAMSIYGSREEEP
jgi:CheY-like chemotaxis protein